MRADRQEAAGVVLAGGLSSRMGRPKAELEWQGTTLLRHTVALLVATVSGPVVVVRTPGQELPALPPGVAVVADPVQGIGPLQGIATGLARVEHAASTAFVCSTDLPFLHAMFVLRVLRALDERDTEGALPDVALPVARGYRQPLAAGYRTALARPAADVIAAGGRRPGQLFERVRVCMLDEAALLTDPQLARFDPALDSLTNVNTPEDYEAALARSSPAGQPS